MKPTLKTGRRVVYILFTAILVLLGCGLAYEIYAALYGSYATISEGVWSIMGQLPTWERIVALIVWTLVFSALLGIGYHLFWQESSVYKAYKALWDKFRGSK